VTNNPYLFITGTDTEIGKTYAAGCIAHTLIQQGMQVIPHKPIASGCIEQDNGMLLSEDALFLKQSCQSESSLQTICPYQFVPPISPQTALAKAGLTLSIKDLVGVCGQSTTAMEKVIHLVEGAGGFLSPICSDGLNKHLAMALNASVVLVGKNQLGCINHILLSLEAIINSGLSVHSVILNYADQQDYAAGLEDWTDVPIHRLNYQADQRLQTIDHFKL